MTGNHIEKDFKVETYLRYRFCRNCDKKMIYSHYSQPNDTYPPDTDVFAHECPECGAIHYYDDKYPRPVYKIIEDTKTSIEKQIKTFATYIIDSKKYLNTWDKTTNPYIIYFRITEDISLPSLKLRVEDAGQFDSVQYNLVDQQYYLVKVVDHWWVTNRGEISVFYSPDNAEPQLPADILLQFQYYPTDPTKKVRFYIEGLQK